MGGKKAFDTQGQLPECYETRRYLCEFLGGEEDEDVEFSFRPEV